MDIFCASWWQQVNVFFHGNFSSCVPNLQLQQVVTIWILNLIGWWNEVQTWRYESRGITTFWSKPIERLGSNAYNIIWSVRYMEPIILKMLIETPILFYKLLCFCENGKWESLNTVTICHNVGAARDHYCKGCIETGFELKHSPCH